MKSGMAGLLLKQMLFLVNSETAKYASTSDFRGNSDAYKSE